MSTQTHPTLPQPPAWLTRQDQRAYFARIVAALPRPRPQSQEWVLRVALAAAFPPSHSGRLH